VSDPVGGLVLPSLPLVTLHFLAAKAAKFQGDWGPGDRRHMTPVKNLALQEK